MTIGGIQKLTLQDYPGYLSAIIFTQGCQLKCPYCHNADIAFNVRRSQKTSESYSVQEALDFLARKAGKLDGVVISGGEPLLNYDLPEFLAQIKDMGYSVKLDTNGLLPQRLREVNEGNLIDYVALDYKAPSSRWDIATGTQIESCQAPEVPYNNWSSSLSYLLEQNIDFELRTTVVREFLSEQSLKEMAASLLDFFDDTYQTHYEIPWYLQRYEEPPTLPPESPSMSAYSPQEMSKLAKKLQEIYPHTTVRS